MANKESSGTDRTEPAASLPTVMANKESSGTDRTEPAASLPTVIASLVGLVGVIAAILALPQYRLVWFAVVAIALIPPVLSWLWPKMRRSPRWQSLGPWLAALLVVATGAALVTAFQHSSNNVPGAASTESLPQAHEDPEGPITIKPPSNAGDAGECLNISLSGQVPAGEELVVANQLQGSNQWYFKPASQGTDIRTWSAMITLGSRNMPKHVQSQTFTIYVALMTKWLADYLATTQQYQSGSNTFWASSEWPPSALEAGETTVIRTQVTGPASCPP